MKNLPIRFARVVIVAAALASSPVWAADFNFNHLVSNIEHGKHAKQNPPPAPGPGQ